MWFFYSEVQKEDAIRAIEKTFGRSVSPVGCAEGMPDRRRTFDGGSCSLADQYSAQVYGFADDWVYQGKERDSHCPGLRRAQKEPRRTVFLGPGVLCFLGG